MNNFRTLNPFESPRCFEVFCAIVKLKHERTLQTTENMLPKVRTALKHGTPKELEEQIQTLAEEMKEVQAVSFDDLKHELQLKKTTLSNRLKPLSDIKLGDKRLIIVFRGNDGRKKFYKLNYPIFGQILMFNHIKQINDPFIPTRDEEAFVDFCFGIASMQNSMPTIREELGSINNLESIMKYFRLYYHFTVEIPKSMGYNQLYK